MVPLASPVSARRGDGGGGSVDQDCPVRMFYGNVAIWLRRASGGMALDDRRGI